MFYRLLDELISENILGLESGMYCCTIYMRKHTPKVVGGASNNERFCMPPGSDRSRPSNRKPRSNPPRFEVCSPTFFYVAVDCGHPFDCFVAVRDPLCRIDLRTNDGIRVPSGGPVAPAEAFLTFSRCGWLQGA